MLTVGYRKLGLIGTAAIHRGRISDVSGRDEYQPDQPDDLRHADGHRHGAFHPRLPDRRADQREAASARHRHFHASIQPFDRRDAGRERDGRGAQCAARSNLSASGLDPELVRQLLDPLPGSQVVIAEGARVAMADAIHLVFVIAFVAAALAMVTVFFTPHKELTEQLPERDHSAVSAD